MENKSTEFWNNRVNNFGHTGWADFNTYAYDQPARLKSIKQLLAMHNIKGRIAFDFGCGTGDFSNMLCEFFDTVKGFDISENAVQVAKEKYHTNKRIEFFTGCGIEQLPMADKSVDLILSITVLDHIRNDNELADTLRFFHRKLTKAGTLLVLEYAPSEAVAEKNEYQRFDLYNTWKQRFSQCGFTITKEYGFYHPQHAPSVSYEKYMANNERKVWQALSRFKFAKIKTASVADKIVSAHNDFFYESSNKDLLKIMMLNKSL